MENIAEYLIKDLLFIKGIAWNKEVHNMKKKVLKVLCGTLAACALFATPVFAEDYQLYGTRNKKSGNEIYYLRRPDMTDSVHEDEEYIGPVRFLSMYRLYNPNTGEHFYTSKVGEKDYLVKIGWNDEGIAWYSPEKSNHPIYRLYNPNAGDHHYTTNVGERNYLIKVGWKDEGIGWYGADHGNYVIYRQYNPNAKTGTHNYTGNISEKDSLINAGWKDEGVAFEEELINTKVADKYGISSQNDNNSNTITEVTHKSSEPDQIDDTTLKNIKDILWYVNTSMDYYMVYSDNRFMAGRSAPIYYLQEAKKIADSNSRLSGISQDIEHTIEIIPETIETNSIYDNIDDSKEMSETTEVTANYEKIKSDCEKIMGSNQ